MCYENSDERRIFENLKKVEEHLVRASALTLNSIHEWYGKGYYSLPKYYLLNIDRNIIASLMCLAI